MPGGSWKTAVIGYIIIALDLLNLVGDAIEKEGMPTDLKGWIIFVGGLATGIGLVLAKDFNVSNAPQPVASGVISTAAAETPNPSQPKP